MVKRSPHEKRKSSTKKTSAQKRRGHRRINSGGRAYWQCLRDLPEGKHCSRANVPMASEIQRRRNRSVEEKHSSFEGDRSRKRAAQKRTHQDKRSTLRLNYRATIAQKKRQLGLDGNLRNKHLSPELRQELVDAIDEARAQGESVFSICHVLEVNSRSYYRWKDGDLKKLSGGGGKNKLTPREENAIVKCAEKHPDWSCRRVAYSLEQKGRVSVGKTTTAIIMKENGLNHPFEKKIVIPAVPPSDELLHEPWRKNLLWGLDWTWVNVAGKFMFFILILDWYSRKIVTWGLYHQVTSFEVVAVITDAVAKEGIDLLPEGHLKPLIVADHGSANISKRTRANIEIQGLDLWLSGVGRPTGNARTERVFRTMKDEEINLQREYSDEKEAVGRIGASVYDYNYFRPNAGNGGFAPAIVHSVGRKILMERRLRGRQTATNKRRIFWNKEEAAPVGTMT